MKQYVLDGLQGRWEWMGQRWVRLTANCPRRINLVEFFLNGNLIDIAYQEPFYVNYERTWIQKRHIERQGINGGRKFLLADGEYSCETRRLKRKDTTLAERNGDSTMATGLRNAVITSFLSKTKDRFNDYHRELVYVGETAARRKDRRRSGVVWLPI